MEIVAKFNKDADNARTMATLIQNEGARAAEAWAASAEPEAHLLNRQAKYMGERRSLVMRNYAALARKLHRENETAFANWVKLGEKRYECPEAFKTILGYPGEEAKKRVNRFLVPVLCMKALPRLEFAKFAGLGTSHMRSHAAHRHIVSIVCEWFETNNKKQLKRWGVIMSYDDLCAVDTGAGGSGGEAAVVDADAPASGAEARGVGAGGASPFLKLHVVVLEARTLGYIKLLFSQGFSVP